ncbi:MAG: hypothetical protein JXA21_22405 [Anaerolineae bacterium]|nr:hypothetical protein [Anaerolineae bacterium]
MDSNLASAPTLGQLIGAHKLTFGQKWGRLIGGIIGILLGPGIAFGLPLFWAGVDSQALQEITKTPFYQYMPLGLGVLAAVMGLFTLINVWRNWPLAMNVYENGFEYIDRHGVKTNLWEEVESVRQQVIRYYQYGFIPSGTSYWISLQTKNGGYFIVDNRFSKVKKLAEAVQERVANSQLPKYLADLEAGNRIEFGSLGFDHEGVYQSNKKLPWNEVGKVEFKSGNLVISKKGAWGSWYKASVAEMPNAVLFVVIAKRYLTTQ